MKQYSINKKCGKYMTRIPITHSNFWNPKIEDILNENKHNVKFLFSHNVDT